MVVVTSRLSKFLWVTGVRRLLDPRSNVVLLSKTSFKVVVPEGTPPSQTPDTVDTPATLTKEPSVATPVILLNVGTVLPRTL